MGGLTTVKGALAGTRIVEWSSGRPAAYAGKLLRGLGAEVTILEEDGVRIGAFAPGPVPGAAKQFEARTRFLHGGKRSAAFDPSATASRELARALLSKADILVMDQHLPAAKQAGMSPEELQKQFPRLIIVSISLAGPGESARNLRYSDLVAHAISGIAFGTPSRVPDIETHPPLKPGGYQADYSCGLHAAIAALLGLQLRRRTDTGQLVHISALEMLASYMRIDIAYLTYGAATAATASGGDRQSPTGRFSTIWGLVPCKDGYYAFQASEQYQWASLMKTMGDPEWAKDPRYADPTNRTLLWDEIEPHVVEWSMAHSKADIFHTAQANHVPVFPCYTVEELINDRQQSARAFFTSLPDGEMDNLVRVPGAIVHLERTPWRPSFEPPAYGEHTAEVTRELESAG